MDGKTKRSYFGKMKRTFFIIVLLLIVVGAFEFYPAVRHFRQVVPEEVYVGKTCDCQCIADSRPWYSVLNYWFWLWFLTVPLVVFSVKPQSPQWQRITRTLVAILFCYGVMNLAIHLMRDIRNKPFTVDSNPNTPWQKSWDMPDCANIGDGANLIFTLMFGWLYAIIYTGWWEVAWHLYHKQHTRLIDTSFKRDILSALVVLISKSLTVLGLLFAGLIFIAFSVAWALEKTSLLPVLKSFFVQLN